MSYGGQKEQNRPFTMQNFLRTLDAVFRIQRPCFLQVPCDQKGGSASFSCRCHLFLNALGDPLRGLKRASCGLRPPHFIFLWNVLFWHTSKPLYFLSSQSLLKIWIETWYRSDRWGHCWFYLSPHPLQDLSWSVFLPPFCKSHRRALP